MYQPSNQAPATDSMLSGNRAMLQHEILLQCFLSPVVISFTQLLAPSNAAVMFLKSHNLQQIEEVTVREILNDSNEQNDEKSDRLFLS